MQTIVNGIPNLLVSQSGKRVIGPLFCLLIIVIGAEFVLFLVGQEVFSQGRGILGQEYVHSCWPVHLHTSRRLTIRSGLNFAKFWQYKKYWLIEKNTLVLWDAGTRVCRPYKTKHKSHNQLGQQDFQICCDSRLIY